MIGFVLVSHSSKLAEGLSDLAAQIAQAKVPLATAGGSGDAGNLIGTDAFRVLQAIESVYSDDGVLIFADLGSAVLSTRTALELLDEPRRRNVRLHPGPFVEGAVSAVTLAAAGAALEEILDPSVLRFAPAECSGAERLVSLRNRLGLHARPAALLVRLVRRFEAHITLENTTDPAGPVEAGSISAVLGLGARGGHTLRIRAEGAQASAAMAAVADFLESGCGDPSDTEAAAVRVSTGDLKGIPVSAGIAIGPLARHRRTLVEVDHATATDPDAEWQRLTAALEAARKETLAALEWARSRASEGEAGIFDAQLLLLEDSALLEAASDSIRKSQRTAASAWLSATGAAESRIAALDDPYQRARAADVRDVAHRVLRFLTGTSGAPVDLVQPSILAARDLTPSEVTELDAGRVLGICLETGSASAHAAILIRALGIPAVAGLGARLAAVDEGVTVAIDGERGSFQVSPNTSELEVLKQRVQTWEAARRIAVQQRHAPACTRDGKRVTVLANINREADAADSLSFGADGVGVLRTEFLFLKRAQPPSEQEQFEAYRTIAQALGTRPLVIRTLDIGGDKNVPYIEAGVEQNPFLGWRGIRLTLGQPELFRTQLRAILRAGYGYPVEILLPMISCLSELRAARAQLQCVLAELARERAAFDPDIRLGVMIEVPAAVFIADQLAQEAGRLSIGTNDLVQYAMAADRTNARVAGIANYFEPSILRMIRHTLEAGRRAGIPVDLCGEMAADPLATPLLIGLGVEEFSVSPPLIPELKQAIARWTCREAGQIAEELLCAGSGEEVRARLAAATPAGAWS